MFVALGWARSTSGDPLLSQGLEGRCKTTTGENEVLGAQRKAHEGFEGEFQGIPCRLMTACMPTLPHAQPACPAWVDLLTCIPFPVESVLEKGITAGDGPRSGSKCLCIFSAFIVSLVIASVYTKSDK